MVSHSAIDAGRITFSWPCDAFWRSAGVLLNLQSYLVTFWCYSLVIVGTWCILNVIFCGLELPFTIVFTGNACVQTSPLPATKKGELTFNRSGVKYYDGWVIYTAVYHQENFHAFVMLATSEAWSPLTGFFNQAARMSCMCSTSRSWWQLRK